jgi:hypothetical protein
MSDHDTLFQSIKGLAESLPSLNQQAVREYTSVVARILRSRSRDTRHIEHTLDGLLGFCGFAPALKLYKKLCRHYWKIADSTGLQVLRCRVLRRRENCSI